MSPSPAAQAAAGPWPGRLVARVGRSALALIVAAVLATIVTLGLMAAGAPSTAVFVTSAIALAMLAGVVGEGTDQLGHRLGPGATGVVQSALGNLPELFISIFALRAGLVVVVQTALIGSILANSLLVLGLAFFLGGLRHGVQRFGVRETRMIATLLLLAVGALIIPTLATVPGAPDAGHDRELSLVVAAVLLVVFAVSVPFSVSGGPGAGHPASKPDPAWPFAVAVAVLAVAAVGAAFVSDWFVTALGPAMAALGLSEAFVGLVVVAIAGNAVENVVGVQAMVRNQGDLAISLILNSSLQVALALTPALVLLSLAIGGPALTLVAPPLLVAALAMSAILGLAIVADGESTLLEGLALVGLYVIVAASVWWGPPISR